MSLAQNAFAPAVAVAVSNQQFQPAAQVLQRKILIMGTYLPAQSGITNYLPVEISSPQQAGSVYGFGSMLHRMAIGVFNGMASQGSQVPVYVMPDSETNITTAVAATGTFTITATSSLAGTLSVYVDNLQYSVPVTAGASADSIGAAIAAAINADKNCPGTAVDLTGVVTLTAKSKGVWGNAIPLGVSIRSADVTPGGVSVVVVAMGSVIPGSGTNTDSINAMLAALGTGDNTNGAGFTEVICGYHQDQNVIAAIGTYCGLGNTQSGLFAPTVHRPFRCLWGDITTGASVPTGLSSLASTNNLDRCNGIIAAPGSNTHPEEIAATAIGIMSVVNNINPASPYVGLLLPGIEPGYAAGVSGIRWTDSYAQRVAAMGEGVGFTQAQGSALYLSGTISFYCPVSVAATSNGYREMRNMSVLQNELYNIWLTFSGPSWQQITIVKDPRAVTNPIIRQKVRSLDDFNASWVALIDLFVSMAWLYDGSLAVSAIAGGSATAIRPAGDGFTAVIPGILSGIGNVFDNQFNFDIAIPSGS